MNVTKVNLNEALRRTRQQKTYLSIKDVAETIKENFEPEEIKALVREVNRNCGEDASEDYPNGGTVESYDLISENDVGAII